MIYFATSTKHHLEEPSCSKQMHSSPVQSLVRFPFSSWVPQTQFNFGDTKYAAYTQGNFQWH